MRGRRLLAAGLMLGLLWPAGAAAQEPGLVVGDVEIGQLQWGRQRASFTLTNEGDWLRWATVRVEIGFTGKYLNPHRVTKQHYAVEPGQTRVVRPAIDVPPNYGQAEVRISVYDVIDTLDVLLESQKVFEKPIVLRFEPPPEIAPYLEERITLPPMVENGPRFDNDFSHILPFLLNEGYSVKQIAAACRVDTVFVERIINDWIRSHHVAVDSTGAVRLTFPVISHAEAQEAGVLARKLSDTLALLIARNLAGYSKMLDSLVAAGALDPDTNAFLNGGAVLMHRYPVVTALLLWANLGQRFINATPKTLSIYAQTDPCKASIPEHMYAVQAGPELNGRHYYSLLVNDQTLQIDFADSIPGVVCPENPFIRYILRERREWHYAEAWQPESFMFDPALTETAVRALENGLLGPLQEVLPKLAALSQRYGHGKLLHEGYRYWFWNLVATRTVDRLLKDGVLRRRGNGHYQFMARL